MSLFDALVHCAIQADAEFARVLLRYAFTSTLVQNPISRVITECLFLAFVALFWYELLYWSGIYLGVWEYHAKDIFKEVPVHCAHVYVRLNIVKKSNLDRVRSYYQSKRGSTYNIFKWRELNEMGKEIFQLNQFVKYHFEFSPEDFEGNPEPEFGSTVKHLREKILETFLRSTIHEKYYSGLNEISIADVFIFDNEAREVKQEEDMVYLSKTHIETGNVIDSIIFVPSYDQSHSFSR